MNNPSMSNYADESDYLTSQDAGGLSAVDGSIAYNIAEVERHLHSYEHWFETAAVPDAEDHVADHIGDGSGAFVPDAGNDDWGAWVQLLGADDTPHVAGHVKYDFHELLVENSEKAATYFIQIGYGASGAAALAAHTYSELVYVGALGAGNPTALEIKARRQDVGTKAWIRLKVPGENTGNLSVYFGIHEYEG